MLLKNRMAPDLDPLASVMQASFKLGKSQISPWLPVLETSARYWRQTMEFQMWSMSFLATVLSEASQMLTFVKESWNMRHLALDHSHRLRPFICCLHGDISPWQDWTGHLMLEHGPRLQRRWCCTPSPTLTHVWVPGLQPWSADHL